jgi:hypothetical protein
MLEIQVIMLHAHTRPPDIVNITYFKRASFHLFKALNQRPIEETTTKNVHCRLAHKMEKKTTEVGKICELMRGVLADYLALTTFSLVGMLHEEVCYICSGPPPGISCR